MKSIEDKTLYQILMRKVRDQRPEFNGAIAYNDQTGRQIVIYNDADIRAALHMRGKLKLYSTVAYDKNYIAAADMVRSPRSQSVPPNHARFSPEERSPSSVDTNYNYRQNDRNSPSGNPPPQSPYPTYGRQTARNAPSPGGISYATYGYGQPLLYGMPPHNLLLAHFLTGGHYPFSRFSWVGPNKYGNFGPYPYRHFYNKGGFGPMW
ncbi:hypothetical protein M3Y97_00064200 [Aphelenchoides bicaudatus]|nr:hypothetical protein M3Y97_00064200 [Aphelenchoides bicaudatus]